MCNTCGFSSFNPYTLLGVERNASKDEIKKAYRKKALQTHPDRNPDDPNAQKRFADVTNAFDILKDPAKRQQYDFTGRVHSDTHHSSPGSGFQFDMNQWMAAQQHFRRMHEQQGRRRMESEPGVLRAGMEVWIRQDVGRIHSASRASNIKTDNDESRALYAGHTATVAKVDSSDSSCKLRVMVSPGRAIELWFGQKAVWDPRILKPDLQCQISGNVDTIHQASRTSGINTWNDDRRSKCVGKTGTIVKVDRDDQSAKIRVMVTPTRADELWFGMGAFDPI